MREDTKEDPVCLTESERFGSAVENAVEKSRINAKRRREAHDRRETRPEHDNPEEGRSRAFQQKRQQQAASARSRGYEGTFKPNSERRAPVYSEADLSDGNYATNGGNGTAQPSADYDRSRVKTSSSQEIATSPLGEICWEAFSEIGTKLHKLERMLKIAQREGRSQADVAEEVQSLAHIYGKPISEILEVYAKVGLEKTYDHFAAMYDDDTRTDLTLDPKLLDQREHEDYRGQKEIDVPKELAPSSTE